MHKINNDSQIFPDKKSALVQVAVHMMIYLGIQKSFQKVSERSETHRLIFSSLGNFEILKDLFFFLHNIISPLSSLLIIKNAIFVESKYLVVLDVININFLEKKLILKFFWICTKLMQTNLPLFVIFSSPLSTHLLLFQKLQLLICNE